MKPFMDQQEHCNFPGKFCIKKPQGWTSSVAVNTNQSLFRNGIP